MAMGDQNSIAPDVQRGFLSQPMGIVGIIGFGIYFLFVSIVSIYLLVGVWPGKPNPAELLMGSVRLDAGIETRLVFVTLLSGALGSFVHSATSFASYLGNRKLVRSWAWWYILRPFIGMALALIFYFLIRGGFVTPGADPAAISPFGIAAVSALVGMFSKQAADKLKELFDQLFGTAEDEKRGDKLA